MDDDEVRGLLKTFHDSQMEASKEGMRLGSKDLKKEVERHRKTLYGKNGKGGLVTQVSKNKSSIGWLKWAIVGVVAIALGVAGILAG